jgi:hypothetical protein
VRNRRAASRSCSRCCRRSRVVTRSMSGWRVSQSSMKVSGSASSAASLPWSWTVVMRVLRSADVLRETADEPPLPRRLHRATVIARADELHRLRNGDAVQHSKTRQSRPGSTTTAVAPDLHPLIGAPTPHLQQHRLGRRSIRRQRKVAPTNPLRWPTKRPRIPRDQIDTELWKPAARQPLSQRPTTHPPTTGQRKQPRLVIDPPSHDDTLDWPPRDDHGLGALTKCKKQHPACSEIGQRPRSTAQRSPDRLVRAGCAVLGEIRRQVPQGVR